MVSQAQQPVSPAQSVSWCHSIGTRDGTLTKDAKIVNAFCEVTENGPALVKRPGTSAVQGPGAGAGQGGFMCNGYTYFIAGDSIRDVTGSFNLPISAVTANGQQYYCLSDVPAGTSYIKSASGLWKFVGNNGAVGGTLTKITDVNYPATTMPGIAYLDGIYYVMDTSGTVRGSIIDDGTTWPALNFIQADFSLGSGVGIHRHMNFIIAYYTKGTQFYYDANAANGQVTQGTQLGPVTNASWTTGLASGDSVVELLDSTYFIAKDGRRPVAAMFNGLEMAVISTPYVEKILALSSFSSVHAFGIRIAGHSFYVVTLVDLNLTLVYDIAGKLWQLWSSVVAGVEQYFVGGNYIEGAPQDYLQNVLDGSVMKMDAAVFTDVSGPINVTAVTAVYDYGTINYKRVASMFFLGDVINTNITVSYSDDDYQSWNNPRVVSLATVKKMLQRGGRFRRRAFKMFHADATPLRLIDAKFDLAVLNS